MDTSYIQSFYNDLIVRVYSSNQNNFIQLNDLEQDVRLRYQPNDYFNLGVGFNYKWFGINVGTKIPYFSDDDNRFGKSTSLGIQSYLYARKFTVDILALKTKGYYLSLADNHDLAEKGTEIYYQRRDLKTINLGLNMNYVLNHERFSYKAAFKQNELQKKSAGSLIFGGGIYMLNVEADSAFVPREIDDIYFSEWRNLDDFKSITLNANIGYAYSYVPQPNWIITGSYRFSLGLQQNVWHYTGDDDNWQAKLSRSHVFRVSGGHHFPGFYLGASFVRYEQNSSMKTHSLSMLNGTNYTEFTISKRIDL